VSDRGCCHRSAVLPVRSATDRPFDRLHTDEKPGEIERVDHVPQHARRMRRRQGVLGNLKHHHGLFALRLGNPVLLAALVGHAQETAGDRALFPQAGFFLHLFSASRA
jgi:hypothetical protein